MKPPAISLSDCLAIYFTFQLMSFTETSVDLTKDCLSYVQTQLIPKKLISLQATFLIKQPILLLRRPFESGLSILF